MAYARLTLAAALVALAAAPALAAGNGDASPQQKFSAASLHGAYAGIFRGEVFTGKAWEPFLGTGVFIADGGGHLSGHETYKVGTQVCTATISGTYTVESDGAGSDAVTFTAEPGCQGGKYTQSLAIADHGELVLLVNTNADRIEEEWHSQQ